MDLQPTQGDENGSCSATTVDGGTTLPFVISTGAYSDFLLRVKKAACQIIKATGLHRKSGGAQWRDLRFSGSFPEVF